MFSASLILVFAVLIAIPLVQHRRKKEHASGLAAALPLALGGIGVMGTLSLGAFIGLMIATAGGALFPQVLRIAEPFVCDGTANTESSGYSYKPGQRGVQRNIICDAGDGSPPRDVTLRSIAVSAAIYGAVAAAVLLIPTLLLGQWLSRRWPASGRKRPGVIEGGDPATDVEALGNLLRAASQGGAGDALRSWRAAGGRGTSGTAEIEALQVLLQNARHVVVDPVSSTTSVSFESGSSGDPATRLVSLMALHEQGLLTSDEYEEKRAQILSQL